MEVFVLARIEAAHVPGTYPPNDATRAAYEEQAGRAAMKSLSH